MAKATVTSEVSSVPTVGARLRQMQATLPELFRDGNTEELVKLHETIKSLSELIGEIRSTHDKLVDMRDDGMFGDNFCPELKRLRAKNTTLGRPKKEKVDKLADLDF